MSPTASPPTGSHFLERLTAGVRAAMSGEKPVRVRLAPSPTGPLHIGTARTGLINYLFAKKAGGDFILRIEDTDLERSDPKFEKDIIEELLWLGIPWTEGVLPEGKNAGRLGPYRQSGRGAHYLHAAEQLLREERAYYCFCSKEKLDAERRSQREEKKPQKYSGTCRVLISEESRKRVLEGERALLRLRMPDDEMTFTDLIRGEIAFDMGLVGDIPIAKAYAKDGEAAYSPLYNFAVVVDDVGMRITHVLRGEDHIANTPKQIAIARALGVEAPAYGHMPLILGPDKAKLSKRHGATTVKAFRELGYYPEALLNFLALLGFNPGTDEHGDLFTLDELVDAFDLSKVQQSGAIWDHKKLQWFNQQYARRDLPLIRSKEDKPPLRESGAPLVPPDLVSRARDLLGEKAESLDDHQLAELLLVLLERTPPEDMEQTLREDVAFFFTAPNPSLDLLTWKDMSDREVRDILSGAHLLLSAIADKSWTRAEIESILLASAGEQTRADGKVDRGRLLWPLRVALTGKKKSPGPAEVAAILGKEETLRRIKTISESL